MKIIFLGTPAFAVPTLQALINSESHQVVAVVTQPEKQAGRGKKIVTSDVEKFATKQGLPVYKFNRIRKQGVEVLSQINADIIVTCAYGQILSKEILEMKKYGVINVHGSILPKYRGSSPIQWTIINGESEAGISIMKSFVGIDDGDVYKIISAKIKENETSEELFDRLSHIAPEHLIDVLNNLQNGTAIATPQNHDEATVCQKLTKEMSELNFNTDYKQLVNLINGINVWPVAKVNIDGASLKIYKASAVKDDTVQKWSLMPLNAYKNGQVVLASSKQGLVVKAENGFVEFLIVQAENSKKMDAKSFLNGKKINIGSVINE